MEYKGLLIKDGKIEKIKITDSQTIHGLIGNWFTSAFRLPGRDGQPNTIDAYCDDEFLLRGEPMHFAVGNEIYRGGYAYGGPVVIVGGDDSTGETRSLTDEEMDDFVMGPPQMVTVQGVPMFLPMLKNLHLIFNLFDDRE